MKIKNLVAACTLIVIGALMVPLLRATLSPTPPPWEKTIPEPSPTPTATPPDSDEGGSDSASTEDDDDSGDSADDGRP